MRIKNINSFVIFQEVRLVILSMLAAMLLVQCKSDPDEFPIKIDTLIVSSKAQEYRVGSDTLEARYPDYRDFSLRYEGIATEAISSNRAFSFINSAYAYGGPVYDEFYLEHYFCDIKIYTLSNFDSLHPPGSEVTNYFHFNRSFGYEGSESDSMFQYLNTTEITRYPDVSLSATLNKAPTGDSIQRYIFETTFDDGLVLRDTTEYHLYVVLSDTSYFEVPQELYKGCVP